MAILPSKNEHGLENVYDRSGTPTHQAYDGILFNSKKPLQGAELNEVQQYLGRRMDEVSQSVFSSGDMVTGGSPTRLPDSPSGNTVKIDEGRVFIRGKMFDFAEVELDPPVEGKASVGVRFYTKTVTADDDPSLRNPAVGTRGYQEDGGARVQSWIVWGWEADGGTSNLADGEDPGEYFPVYDMTEGQIILTNTTGAELLYDIVARYDREAHGNYVVGGMQVQFVEETPDDYVFTLGEGLANILGNKVELRADRRFTFEKNPTSLNSNNEPHTFVPDTQGRMNIFTNRSPIASVGEIVGQREKNETVTRGGFSGGRDELVEASVTEVVSVTQGGTVFANGTDFAVEGDEIDWSIGGENQPAPGSSYEVVYRFLTAVEPVNVGIDYITVEDLVPNSLVQVDYDYNLPRIDLVVLDKDGQTSRVEGRSQRRNPATPRAAANQIAIASVTYDWVNPPQIANIAVKAMHFVDMEKIQDRVEDLFSLMAIERLKTDASLRDQTSKHGVFVDPFFDNDLRDQGTDQNALVLEGLAMLPVSTEPKDLAGDANSSHQTLPFELETAIEQPRMTGCTKINPFQAFEPIPANITLNPASDQWTETETRWADDAPTRQLVRGRLARLWNQWRGRWWRSRRNGQEVQVNGQTFLARRVTNQTEVNNLGQTRRAAEFIRSRTVEFTIENFGPGESIAAARFDGVDILGSITNLQANEQGVLSSSFVVPSGVPVGVKQVEISGAGGSLAQTRYVANGTIITTTLQRATITVLQGWDPLAQTFLVDDDMQIGAVDVKFCQAGDTATPVVVQIRETEVGLPNSEVLAEAVVDMRGVTIGQDAWTTVAFPLPVTVRGGQEYAVVLLTDDADHSVGFARLGQYARRAMNEQIDFEGFITAQAFQQGVLLESSNASTWSPRQKDDLTFRLKRCRFTDTTRRVALGNINAENITDLAVLASVARPDATSEVVFEVIDPTNETHTLSEGQTLQLDERTTGNFYVSAVLTGSENMSPVLFPDSTCIVGEIQDGATYVSRAIEALDEFDATIILNVWTGGAVGGVTPTMETQRMSGGNPVIVDGEYQTDFVPVVAESDKQLGDGWVEKTWKVENLRGVGIDRETRIHLALAGSPRHRVLISDLRVIIS